MTRILAIIVLAQFLCTSLWFAGNAIIPDLILSLNQSDSFLAHLTSAVQFGFISGTLVFAVLTVADRYSPSYVFFFSAVIAAAFNGAITYPGITATQILSFRFMTGFFLAGIYPVGMKIASDYFQTGLGKSLGFLVGSLVLGTAFPHLLKSLGTTLPWNSLLFITSTLSILGGLFILLFVPDGPYRRYGQAFHVTAFLSGFRIPSFRAAAFGYFGHMWELYAFWAFVPIILTLYTKLHPEVKLDTSLYSFLIIAVGSFACVISGLLSRYFHPKKLAAWALFFSGLCCLVSPFFLSQGYPWALLTFLSFWGWVVIADSPLFSTLVAQLAPDESRGSALTIVNCIGFAITIVSIQFINLMSVYWEGQYLYVLLAIGPIFGLVALLQAPPHKQVIHE